MSPHRFNLAPQSPLPSQDAVDYADRVLAWSSEAPAGVRTWRDVAYGDAPEQRYDVFAPPDARGAPVLVFWHGGGWTNGYKEFVSFMAPHVARLGMVLVAPGYRLAPAHRLPAAIDDCRQALRVLAGRVADYGGSPRRVILSGHSAGGHLAAMTALQRHQADQAGVPADMIQACLPISGIMDLHHPAPVPGSLEDRVYTMLLRTPDEDALMSPICWTRGNRIPMALTCGERDSHRVRLSNQRLAALLAAQPAPSSLHIEAGRDHFQTHLALRDGDASWYGLLAAHAARVQGLFT